MSWVYRKLGRALCHLADGLYEVGFHKAASRCWVRSMGFMFRSWR